ncbi:sugar ABC transporter substrate-binding protein [Mesorhizobium sp. M2C.T.Ca.TU.002.02.1.1]|uniref:sugar ABC transporter substrate-binding protein n=1 Tax=Mesorhizobium sp. M2C.T.Ca.TU.002.02.1.1 TaxID=2496788 RepID=UPI000FCBDE04|nr:sugar ABC transporter substrate-binding protein [Mesorhizobium sp. M2C.T.Ca.TU.002.02.1.1]RUU60380.1 LacI family transcriptional regulator [Mesorhizobium sp. M2C.T.Ca.TU.002.02.1.1]
MNFAKLTKLLLTTAVVGGLMAPGMAFAAAKGSKVILLTVTEECEYCALHQRAFKEVAAAAGIDLEVKINNYDAAEQASQVDQAIAQKPDAIVLWPADASAIVPSLRKIKQAGIPLVITNSRPDEKYSQFWDVFTGPSDIGNGESAGEAMIKGFADKKLGSEGKVFIVEGVPGTPPQIQRSQGFEDVLGKKASGIQVAGKQNGNWDQTKATDAAAALFTQLGSGVKGVYAQADNMMSGVIVAAKRAGIDPASLVLVGSNCSIEGVNQINDGTQYATVLQSPIDDGKYAAQAVADLLDGKKVEKQIFLPHEIITKANVADCNAALGR